MPGNVSLFDPLLSIGPLWLVGLLLIAACLLAREAGSLLYHYVGRHKNDAKDEGASEAIGATFGLLAFILAFTFSIALDRYDTRRVLVAEEANAIGTVYRQASLFDEPERSRLQEILRQYAHTRIAPRGLWDSEMEDHVRQSQTLRDKFWNEAREAILPVRNSEQGSYFVGSVTEMIEIGNQRELAGRAHVPSRILDVTLVYLLASAGMLGYMRGKKGGRRQASTVLLVLFVIVIVLILDIDQPRAGTVTVPQRAIEDMTRSLDADARAQGSPAAPSPR
ncbi:MAG TPA: hypothetical protein VFS49_12485 [Croceibacterium sp.]|nr:hypothetical protein [Croceibacterium sp.]